MKRYSTGFFCSLGNQCILWTFKYLDDLNIVVGTIPFLRIWGIYLIPAPHCWILCQPIRIKNALVVLNFSF